MRHLWIKIVLVMGVAMLCGGGDCTPDFEDLEEIDIDLPDIIVDDGIDIPDDDVVVIPELPVSVLYENVSSFDIEVGVVYDDVSDAVFVPTGESLVIDLEWCPEQVLVDYEDRFDPFTGDFVEGFDWASTGELDTFLGYDYLCGDTLVYSFGDVDVVIDAYAGPLKAQAKARTSRAVSRPAPTGQPKSQTSRPAAR